MNEEEIALLFEEGYSEEEVNSILDEIEKTDSGKTEEPQKEDAPVVQENTASDSEPGLSASEKELEKITHQAAVYSIMASTGYSEGVIDKVAALTSGTAGFLSSFAKVPSQLTYAAIETGLSVFDPESVDTEEEKLALKYSVENGIAATLSGAAGLNYIAKELDQVADGLSVLNTKHDKSIIEQISSGEVLSAVDQTAQQVMFSAPSVAAAFTGTGGLALLGGSAFGGKFEEEFEKNPMQSSAKLFAVSATSAGIEIVSEKVTLGIANRAKTLLKGTGGDKAAREYVEGTLKYLFKEANMEGMSEAVATVSNKYLDNLAYGREVSLSDLVKEATDSYIVGAVTGGGIAGVGRAGMTDTEKAIVDAKLKPDSAKTDDATNAEAINQLNQIKTEENADAISEVEGKIKERINDKAVSHTEVIDNITDENITESLEIDSQIEQINAELDSEEIPDAAREVLEKEALELKQRKQEIYDEAESRTTNTTQAIDQVNAIPDTSLDEDQRVEQVLGAKQAEEKLTEKFRVESVPGARVSPSTVREIDKGNVELKVNPDGTTEYALKVEEDTGNVDPDQLAAEGIERLLAVEDSGGLGKLGEVTREEQNIYATDPNTGHRIKIQRPSKVSPGELAAKKISKETGYFENVEGADYDAVNNVIQEAAAGVEATTPNTDTPGLGDALSNFDKISKLLRTGSALRKYQADTTGQVPEVSDQHKALTALYAPFKAVSKLNSDVKKKKADLAREKAAKPTTNEQGQTTGGPDPAKIEAIELEIDALNGDIDEALAAVDNTLAASYLDPSVSDNARSASELKARDQSRITTLQDQLAKAKDKDEIANLKRRLKALKDKGVTPDGFSDAQIQRYIKDLKRETKIKTISDESAAKLGQAKKTTKTVNDAAVSLARFTISRAKLNSFGTLTSDVIQEANLAAIEAIQGFTGNTKQELLSAISGKIKSRLTEYRRTQKALPLPKKVQTLVNKIRKAEEKLLGELEYLPSDNQIAEELGITPEEVADAKQTVLINDQLANSDVIIEDSDGGETRLLETVRDVQRSRVDNRSVSQVLFSKSELDAIDKSSDIEAAIEKLIKGRNPNEIYNNLKKAGAQGSLVDQILLPKNESYSARTAINNVKELLKIEAYSRLNDAQIADGYQFQTTRKGIGPSFQLADGKSSESPYVDAILGHMKKIWPNIGVADTKKKFELVKRHLYASEGISIPDHVKGFQYGNIIGFDPTTATPDTYIHEYVHIWVRGLETTNPKLWNKGVELLKGSEFMDLISKNPIYTKFKDSNPSEFYNEVIANAAGKKGAELFQGKKVSQWDQWLKDFGKSVKDMLGISSQNDYADLTLNDFLDVVVQGTTTQSYDAVQPADPVFSLVEGNRKHSKVKHIENLLNDPLKYSTTSPYKHSKVNQSTREFLKNQKLQFNKRGQGFTETQLDDLTALIEERIELGRSEQIGKRRDIKENREDARDEAASVLLELGLDPQELNQNDIAQIAKENTSFINRLRTRGVGGVVADALAPASNDDFYGLISRIARGPNRAKTEAILAKNLTAPLEKGNADYLKNKYEIKTKFDNLIDALGNGDKNKGQKVLKTSSNIKVGRSTLTNSQAVMVYNYIKDPRLFPQLAKGGINPEKATEIIDYIAQNPELRGLADGLPAVYGGFKSKLNRKLDQHGYVGVDGESVIDTSKLSKEQLAVLNKIYDGKIPESAPYSPVFAKGDTSLDLTSDLFEGGKQGDFYTVLSGRLRERNYQGAINFSGNDISTQLDSYIGAGGPVRTEAFLDFAKSSSAFFTSDNLKGFNAALGDSWRKSMEDSLRRIITGSNRGTNSPESVSKLDKWINRSIGNVLFLNPRSAILQMVSIGNFAPGTPNYFKYVGSAKAREARAIIMASPFMKERHGLGQTDVVTQELLTQKGDSEFTRGIDKLSTFGYSLTKAADGVAIALGGAPYLAAKIDEYNGDVERAMQDFMVKANEAQQSTNPERLGRDQTHPVGRYLLAFTNATQQFNRIMAKSARELADGKDRAKNAKKITHIIGTQIALFSGLQKSIVNAVDLENDEEKEQISDWMLGIVDTMVTSAGIIGSVYATTGQAAKQYLRGLDDDGKASYGTDQKVINEFINISPAIGTKVRNIKNIIRQPYKRSQGLFDVPADVTKAANAIQLTGIPADRVLKILESFNDLGANDLYLMEKVSRLIGWSRYDIEQGLGKAGEEKRGGRTLRDRQRDDRAIARKNR